MVFLIPTYLHYSPLIYMNINRLHIGQYLLHYELAGGVGAAGAVGTMVAVGATGGTFRA